jgi:AcrR family transcriptional regulator
LEVATRILQDEGYRSLNIERVAEESGIAKTTIYRRYQDRRDLAAAAVGALLEAHGAFQAPDTGSCRDDIKLVFSALRSAESSPLLSVLGAVLSEGRRDSELLERMWIRAFDPHHRALAAILDRGVERGEVRPDLGIATTIEILVGAVLARLIPGHPVDDDWTESVLRTVWVGIRRDS